MAGRAGHDSRKGTKVAARNKTTETAPANPFAATVSTMEKITKNTTAEPNPAAPAIESAIETGKVLQIVSTKGEHTGIVSKLRSAARDAGVGLKVKVVSEDGDAVSVHFQTVAKRSRSYTTDQIRAWGEENGHDVPEGRIGKDHPLRVAFKAAHGFGRENAGE